MKLTEEQKALAGDPAHIKLATILSRQFVKRYRLHERDRGDEYLSAALLGLCDAATRFDPASGFQFATFAARRIVGSMLDYRRSESGHGFGGTTALARGGAYLAPVEIDHCWTLGDEGEGVELAKVLPADGPPVGWEVESEETVRAVAGRLKGKAREVVEAFFLDAACEGTLRLVAAKVGVSESRASQCLTLAAQQLGGKARSGLRALRSAGGL